ncbi:cecropin A [Danaus plexippus plexippus]|uniref:Cecropin A n=1 Tax=Danaus plexippus plexippus TaxID=278856 RepID=A0A212F3T6_DANPL|nr:cecropin A [Danaus plexippus plexippus]
MNFFRLLFFVALAVMVLSGVSASPSPRWKFLKKIEKVGRKVRDGVIKAGPAVGVVGQATSIYKGK